MPTKDSKRQATPPPTTTAEDQSEMVTEVEGQSEVITGLEPTPVRAKRPELPENHPFRFWVDPRRIHIVKGKAYFLPAAVTTEPGLQGVQDASRVSIMDAYQQDDLGRTIVPMDFEVTAWGKKVKGYVVRRYLGTDLAGKKLYHYHDVWTRFRKVGAILERDFDREGWIAFCRSVESLVGGPPDRIIVEAQRVRVQNVAASLRRSAHRSPGAEANANALESNLREAADA